MISNRYSPRPLRQLLHPHVVDDQQVGLEIPGQHLFLAVERLVVQEVADDVEDRPIQHEQPLLDGLMAEGLDQKALPTPGGPSNSTSRRSRMNRQVARSNTCFRGIDGLNDQSKSSSGFSSRNAAAFTRRSICRCWRTSSSSCRISSRNSAWLELMAGGFLQAGHRAFGPGRRDAVACSVVCRRSFIGDQSPGEDGDREVHWKLSGETEPGSAEEQPGEG